MARTRMTVGPKGRKSTLGRKGWPSKTRSYSWRAGSARPTEALTGRKIGVRSPSSVHRFMRWGSTQLVDTYNIGGGIIGVRVTNQDGVTSSVAVANISANTPAGTGYQFGGSMQFTLNDLPSVTDFTALFDHYVIEQVDVEVDCLQNSASGGGGSSTQADGTQRMPTITYVPDFDDSTVPTLASDINEYQRAKVHTFRGSGKPLKFSIKPRTAITVFRTALSSAYAAGSEGTSLNLAYTDVPHYGVKFWVDNMDSGVGGTGGLSSTELRWKCKYHLKFLDPK